MTTLTAHPFRDTGLFGRFTHFVSDLVSAVREARSMSARYEHLNRLSNTDLARLGFAREDIPQVVVSGR